MNLPPLTYTFLSNYENCPHKAYRLYVLKDIKREGPMPEPMRVGIEAHRALDRRLGYGEVLPATYAAYEPLVAQVETVQGRHGLSLRTELALACDDRGGSKGFWDRPWLRGKLDVHLMSADCTQLLLLDWKTGKEREDPFELQVQASLALASERRLERVKGAYVWLQEKKLGRMYDLSDVQPTLERVKKLEARMKADDWEKTPNALCGFCDVIDCAFNRREK